MGANDLFDDAEDLDDDDEVEFEVDVDGGDSEYESGDREMGKLPSAKVVV